MTALVELEPGLFVLELFHGPTAAFKDLAMQLVAALTDEALAASGERLTILTATSGTITSQATPIFLFDSGVQKRTYLDRPVSALLP